MHASKMNTIHIHINENKTEYVLYIPREYFTNDEIVVSDTDKILKNSKKQLYTYMSTAKIKYIAITNELRHTSFPVISPLNKKIFKYKPTLIFLIPTYE